MIATDNRLGKDTYLFNMGDGHDTIEDNTSTLYTQTYEFQDPLIFGAGIDSKELWFSRDKDNLEITIIGTEDSVTVNNWFVSTDYQIETIQTGDGKTLLSSQVLNLVNAMASFAPPAPGQTSLAADYQSALNPVLAANWK